MEVSPPGIAIDVTEDEHGNYFLRHIEGHVQVVISEKYADSSPSESDEHSEASHDSNPSPERGSDEEGDQVVHQQHSTRQVTLPAVDTDV